MAALESAPSVPPSLPMLPGDLFKGNQNKLLRSATVELQGQIDYHWKQQQDQWHQLRKQLREQHQELLQQFQVIMLYRNCSDSQRRGNRFGRGLALSTDTGLTATSPLICLPQGIASQHLQVQNRHDVRTTLAEQLEERKGSATEANTCLPNHTYPVCLPHASSREQLQTQIGHDGKATPAERSNGRLGTAITAETGLTNETPPSLLLQERQQLQVHMRHYAKAASAEQSKDLLGSATVADTSLTVEDRPSRSSAKGTSQQLLIPSCHDAKAAAWVEQSKDLLGSAIAADTVLIPPSSAARPASKSLAQQLHVHIAQDPKAAFSERISTGTIGTAVTTDTPVICVTPAPGSQLPESRTQRTADTTFTLDSSASNITILQEQYQGVSMQCRNSGDLKMDSRSSMFKWTTARLAKAERQVSARRVSCRTLIREWVSKMCIVPPSFERKHGTNTIVGKILNSKGFLAFSCSLIISNTLYLGWYADFSVKNELRRIDSESPDERPWIVNTIFSVLLVIEVSIRFCGSGPRHYFNIHRFWNVLDLFLAFLAAFSIFHPKDEVPRFFFCRILRFFRLIHTSPMFRLPLFSHLRMITNAWFMSMPSFMWAVTFGSLFLYMGGVYFCLFFAHDLQNKPVQRVTIPARYYFSSLADAMQFLYMALTNGIDWADIHTALKKSDPLMSIGLFCFSVFMVFAVVNIISAMFIERAFNVIRDDRDFWVVEEARRQQEHRKRIFGLFDEMDKDGSGDVTWDEFEKALDNPHIEAYLSFVDLDVSNLHDIFHLLDKDKNGSVDIREFLDGLEVLKGPAKRVEVLRMYDLICDFFTSELRELDLHSIAQRKCFPESQITSGGGAPDGGLQPLNRTASGLSSSYPGITSQQPDVSAQF